MVECKNIGFDHAKQRPNWSCHAEISERVKFNHVEVICEGYDYPEDDYILLGSCGLEFTLDYTDPRDYHEKSYFKHLDDHEKEMHHERFRPSAGSQPSKHTQGYLGLFMQIVNKVYNHSFLIGAFLVLVLFSLLLVRFFASGKPNTSTNNKKQSTRRGASYGPLASAVIATKKISWYIIYTQFS